MSEYITKKADQQELFETGSHRGSREGKGRFDLIPPKPMMRIAGVYERGARIYGDRNWEKGQPVSRYIDSALRHIFNYLDGEASEDHLAQGAWNLIGAMHTEETMPEMQDIPARRRVP